MPLLLNCDEVSKSYDARLLFENISLIISDRERIGLIGPNGSGKSTLLKILAGVERPDRGQVSLRKQMRLTYLPQVDAFALERKVDEIVQEGLTDSALDQHERELRAEVVLTQVGFAPDQHSARFGELSGGWRKRVALARALIGEPELLLLDEPTNHLDLEGILWLEKLLGSARFAYLLVSHDRCFLESVTHRIVELNACYPRGFLSIEGSYSTFIRQREGFLAGQLQAQRSIEAKLRRETEWLQRKAPARTTKARARCDEAARLMDELADLKQRNTQTSGPKIDFTSTDRQANRLLIAKHISKSLGERKLIEDLSLVLTPGSKLGLLGPNGSGKTTLLRLLAGALEPDAGQLQRAERLRVVYFDQNREQLSPGWTLREALAPSSGDLVTFRDQTMHITAWAKRFLFRSEQLNLPLKSLSGGEHARVMIARLMLQPADLLLLDEPTNDLDITALEVLEESLDEFSGAVVIVTHDRFMLQRLEAELMGLDGEGSARFYNDYREWETTREQAQAAASRKPESKAEPRNPARSAKRLSYKEQQEWAQMESAILQKEAEVAALHLGLEDPKLTSDPLRLQQHCSTLAAAQAEVDRLFHRWQELEEKQAK